MFKEIESMNITKRDFAIKDSSKVFSYTLENDHGMQLTCLNIGCIVTEIIVPDASGNFENVVLGFNTLEDYLQHMLYFGAVVGRVAGRIKGATFELDGVNYELPKNEGNNHLHSGDQGFHERVWDATPVEKENAIGIKFSYTSPDGEAGYPGEVTVTVTYWLTNDNQWIQEISGNTDQKTLLNMTNHSYFNLSGNVKTDILDHRLTLKSSLFLQLDDEFLPTGDIIDVTGTVFDFRNGRKLRDGISSVHPQNILVGNGYDHPFSLDENFNQEIILEDENSGRRLTIETDRPCVVLYTGNGIPEGFEVNHGIPARKNLGVCLETQGYPDAIHHSKLPSIVLAPGEEYKVMTTYTFETI